MPEQQDNGPPWKVVGEFLAVGGTLTPFLALVGGLAFAARLYALDVPVDASVALLPIGALLVSGLRALAIGLIASGFVLGIVLFAFRRGTPDGNGRWAIAVSAAVAIVAVSAWPFLTEPLSGKQEAVATGGMLAAIALLGWIAAKVTVRRVAAYALPVLVLAYATVVDLAREFLPPTHLDYVTVRMKSGDVTDGFYLASDGDSVYLAPNVKSRTVNVVAVLPRRRIESIGVSLEEEKAQGFDDELPKARLGPYSKQTDESEPDRRHSEDVLRAAAFVRADVGWKYPPLMPRDQLDFLTEDAQKSVFVDQAIRRVPDPGIDLQRISLKTLLTDPQLAIGSEFLTRGVIVEAIRIEDHGPSHSSWTLVFRPFRNSKTEAYCEATVKNNPRPRAGRKVEVYATLLGWGSFNTRAGDAIRETALLCAAARVE